MAIKLKYGNTNTFLIQGKDANLLIDTDWAGTFHAFCKKIKENGIKLSEITHVIATHYHPDHMGIVSELVDSGAKLIILDFQIPHIHHSDAIFKKDKNLSYKPIDEKNAIVIAEKQSREFLKSIGIDGEIIKTSSHSEDSISIILDDGDCFSGDLEPYEYIAAYDGNKALEDDWDKILKSKAKTVHFSHRCEMVL